MVTVVLGRPSFGFKLKLWLGGHPRFGFKSLFKNHKVELGKLDWDQSAVSGSKRWVILSFTDTKGGVWAQGILMRELSRLQVSEGSWSDLKTIERWGAFKFFVAQFLGYFPRSLSIQYSIALVVTAFLLHPLVTGEVIPNWVHTKTSLYPHLNLQNETLVNLVKTLMLGIFMHALLIGVPIFSYAIQSFYFKSKYPGHRISLKFEFAVFAFLFLTLLRSSVGEWQNLHALEKHFFSQLSQCLLVSSADACEKVETGIAIRARFPASKR